ncbi:Uncharacterised protein [Vibrio metschnikovii]|nr:Uncharacterised protein [Vibrio metschnikovii]SUP50514.1 Uncharacterised protein [Vibrio metschnikovii]
MPATSTDQIKQSTQWPQKWPKQKIERMASKPQFVYHGLIAKLNTMQLRISTILFDEISMISALNDLTVINH